MSSHKHFYNSSCVILLSNIGDKPACFLTLPMTFHVGARIQVSNHSGWNGLSIGLAAWISEGPVLALSPGAQLWFSEPVLCLAKREDA